jgi:hypothetical protein
MLVSVSMIRCFCVNRPDCQPVVPLRLSPDGVSPAEVYDDVRLAQEQRQGPAGPVALL